MSLIVAIKDYFGFKPGQSMHEFMQEVKELTAEDRAYFAREFVKVGYQIT
jgi:hypothetical protein